MKTLRLLLIGSVLLTLASKPVFAYPDEYDDSQSNPFRIAAYLVHPVGWLAEWLIYRPFHFLVSATEPQEAFFGHRPHPPVLAAPMPTGDALDTDSVNPNEPRTLNYPCPCCGGSMIVIETFERGATARYKPSAPAGAMRIDTS
jgi:hypothetical protein